ncbi:nuclear transport factor 2 family protein [Streptomyces canus]|uniref:nuclear transport factor 2 family protein n=1 Tax=Streptomyces canus TaxID=58343 RepID=UPI0032550C29
MQPSPDQNAHDDVTTAFRAYLQAMLNGDTHALDNLLADGCTLTHITGYLQPKDEWLSQTRAGQFLYHGTRANWRLQMTMDYAREGDTWSVVRSAATTW